jgi:hypothetical protein
LIRYDLTLKNLSAALSRTTPGLDAVVLNDALIVAAFGLLTSSWRYSSTPLIYLHLARRAFPVSAHQAPSIKVNAGCCNGPDPTSLLISNTVSG